MIRALFFDLDGTLVQTEKVKALSYARAAVALAPSQLSEKDVMNAFPDVVGLSRDEVAKGLVAKLNLEQSASIFKNKMGVAEGWQTLLQLRLKHYQDMISDPNLLHAYACPFNIGLLRWSHKNGYRTGLATMSHRNQTQRILEILNLSTLFNFTATRDDVNKGKPDPEIYLLLAKVLRLNPEDCLVIEDSPVGIQAALNADMNCIAVTNELTKKSVHESKLLHQDCIVDDLEELQAIVESFIKHNT